MKNFILIGLLACGMGIQSSYAMDSEDGDNLPQETRIKDETRKRGRSEALSPVERTTAYFDNEISQNKTLCDFLTFCSTHKRNDDNDNLEYFHNFAYEWHEKNAESDSEAVLEAYIKARAEEVLGSNPDSDLASSLKEKLDILCKKYYSKRNKFEYKLSLEELTLQRVCDLYTNYETLRDPALRSCIISALEYLRKQALLQDEDKMQAHNMALKLGAGSLAVRIGSYTSKGKTVSVFEGMPNDVSDSILSLLLSGNYGQIVTFLRTSRGFNQSMLRTVKHLDLSRYEKKLTDEVLENIVVTFPNLQALDLDHTPVTDKGLECLTNLSHLTTLSLRATVITDAGLEHVGNLTNLTSFSLGMSLNDDIEFTDAGLAHLAKLTKLTKLTLWGGQDAGLSHFVNLQKLTTLNLDGTQITEVEFAHLGNLTNLRDLSLFNCDGVTDESLVHLVKLTNLTSLNVGLSIITDDCIVHLSKLTNLTSINIHGTEFTDAGLVSLRNLLPQLKISY